jgi:hypothetical protein
MTHQQVRSGLWLGPVPILLASQMNYRLVPTLAAQFMAGEQQRARYWARSFVGAPGWLLLTMATLYVWLGHVPAVVGCPLTFAAWLSVRCTQARVTMHVAR